MVTGKNVGWMPGATASARTVVLGLGLGLGPGRVGPSRSMPGQELSGLTLAGAEALDRDQQALAAGDGLQLALASVGDAVGATDLRGTGAQMWHPLASPCPPTGQALTLVVLVSGQGRAGQIQRAEPSSSTHEDPNSHCRSAQEVGGVESATKTRGSRPSSDTRGDHAPT